MTMCGVEFKRVTMMMISQAFSVSTLHSDMLHKFGIEEGEAREFVLIEVHHEKFVRGREVDLLGGELTVKVGDVFAVPLQREEGRRR